MRDLTRTRFSSNAPERSYYKLSEKVECLESKLNRLEQVLIEAVVKLNKI
jgi:hypothetical protein